MINKYAIYGVVALAVVAAGYTAVNIYTNKVEELETTKAAVSALSLQLEAQSTEFARIEERIKLVELQRKTYERSVLALDNRLEQQKRELISLKNREETVLAKPGLVELKINKAYTAQQKAYMCLTGDKTACE
jgi:DNA repair ATPase RecN